MFKRPEFGGVSIPNGSYQAICKSVVEKERVWRDEPPKPGLQFTYQILLRTGGVVDIPRHVTNSFGPKSNLRKDLACFFTEDEIKTALKSDEAYDSLIKSMVGRSCLAIIENVKSDSTGAEFSNLTGLAPLPPGMEGSPAKAPNGPFYYNINKLSEAHRPKALEMLQKAKAYYESSVSTWVSPIELPKLANCVTAPVVAIEKDITLDEDQIPF